MGGVRGDVIALSFTQTTGRAVTVSNARIFYEPVYNYTREFPYLWGGDERAGALPGRPRGAAHPARGGASPHGGALAEMARRYFVKTSELRPAAFYRMTDNWLELTARFVAPTHAIRELKDAMTRKILKGMRHAGIRVASTTIEIAVP